MDIHQELHMVLVLRRTPEKDYVHLSGSTALSLWRDYAGKQPWVHNKEETFRYNNQRARTKYYEAKGVSSTPLSQGLCHSKSKQMKLEMKSRIKVNQRRELIWTAVFASPAHLQLLGHLRTHKSLSCYREKEGIRGKLIKVHPCFFFLERAVEIPSLSG